MPKWSEVEKQAMARALSLAATPDLHMGGNPRVGCVIISPDGDLLGQGFHRGAGTNHAEVEALKNAGDAARGATAVVTLEPCRHVGRTGPCTNALIKAGIARVVYAQSDPNDIASGGAQQLTRSGLSVVGGLFADKAELLNREWTMAVSRGRPFVILKLATTLDGRVAAMDNSSRWISGPQSRQQVHELRGVVDAVIVGTQTAIVDNPQLTDRRKGSKAQPQRVVIGHTSIPAEHYLNSDGRGATFLQTHDLHDVLESLYQSDVRTVLVEGGPTLAASFLREGLVDRLIWYVAPVLLGSGRNVIEDLGISSIDEALRLTTTSVTQVGQDARIEMEF